MDIELPKDFKEFLSLLGVHRVEYLLIGGYAVGYYGYPRATNDLDIWISATAENASRIVTSLKEFGFDPSELSVTFSFSQTTFYEWELSRFESKS